MIVLLKKLTIPVPYTCTCMYSQPRNRGAEGVGKYLTDDKV